MQDYYSLFDLIPSLATDKINKSNSLFARLEPLGRPRIWKHTAFLNISDLAYPIIAAMVMLTVFYTTHSPPLLDIRI